MYNYLFICAANVGRSQMAEALYNHYSGGKNSISAAGLVDVRENYNYHPHKGITAVMGEIGIDISQNEVKLVSPELIQQCKKIIVLFEKEKCNSTLLEYLAGANVEFRPIKDPYSMHSKIEDSNEIPIFRQTREIIDEFVRNLLN